LAAVAASMAAPVVSSSRESAGGSTLATRGLRPGEPLCATTSGIIEATCCSILDLDKIFIPEKVCISRYQMETFRLEQFLASLTAQYAKLTIKLSYT
jgi:hypothetical protein